MGCCQTKNSGPNLFDPNEEELSFKTYKSSLDKDLEQLEKTYNVFNYFQLLDYINLLKNYEESEDVPFQVDYKTEFSMDEKFMQHKMDSERFGVFIKNKVLTQNDLYTITGSDENVKNLLLEVVQDIFESLNTEINNHYKNLYGKNVFLILTKRNMLAFAFLYCQSLNINKVRLAFDLFQEDNLFTDDNESFDDLLITCFILASIAILKAREKVGGKSPKVPPLLRKTKREANEFCNLGCCEKLLEEFKENFFDKKKFTFEEFKQKFESDAKQESFGWIFSASGIRQKLESLQ